MKDMLGFIWYLTRGGRKVLAFVLYVVAIVLGPTAPYPWDYICASYVLFIVGVWIYPMVADIIKDEYRQYRAQKEEAWNVLKDTK